MEKYKPLHEPNESQDLPEAEEDVNVDLPEETILWVIVCCDFIRCCKWQDKSV